MRPAGRVMLRRFAVSFSRQLSNMSEPRSSCEFTQLVLKAGLPFQAFQKCASGCDHLGAPNKRRAELRDLSTNRYFRPVPGEWKLDVGFSALVQNDSNQVCGQCRKEHESARQSLPRMASSAEVISAPAPKSSAPADGGGATMEKDAGEASVEADSTDLEMQKLRLLCAAQLRDIVELGIQQARDARNHGNAKKHLVDLRQRLREANKKLGGLGDDLRSSFSSELERCTADVAALQAERHVCALPTPPISRSLRLRRPSPARSRTAMESSCGSWIYWPTWLPVEK